MSAEKADACYLQNISHELTNKRGHKTAGNKPKELQ